MFAILTILAFLGSQAETRETDYCYADEQDPYLYMSTKSAYEFVRGAKSFPPIPSCEPKQIWVVARHGARYPKKELSSLMMTLPKLRDQIVYNHENRGYGRLCNSDLDNLKNWKVNTEMSAMPNNLTTQGAEDLRLLAKRLQSEFPNLLKADARNITAANYKFRSSNSERTILSMKSFMTGLFDSPYAVQPENRPVNDSLLTDYKLCPTWQKSLRTDNVSGQMNEFISGVEFTNLLQTVSRRLGFLYDLKYDSVKIMYDMCRYEKAWNIVDLSVWCSVFNKNELKILEYADDLHYYYSYGSGREINKKLGCSLLKDAFTHFRRLERGDSYGEPKGIFSFTHSASIHMLVSLMGFKNDYIPLTAANFASMDQRLWRSSFIAPFGGNLVAIFYRCDQRSSKNKVMFYLSETPVAMGGCDVGLCSWEYLKEKFTSVFDCNLDFCKDENSKSSIHKVDFFLIFASLLIASSVYRSSVL